MSDTITKYWEMVADGRIDPDKKSTTRPYIYESPDGGLTVTQRPFGGDISDREVISKPIVSEGTKQKAYRILVEYSKEAILEAARILKSGE